MELCTAPLTHIGQERSYDISVHVNGGGVSGQRDAILLGIARALEKIDPDLRGTLKREGFLSRDARVKERKKPGLKLRAQGANLYQALDPVEPRIRSSHLTQDIWLLSSLGLTNFCAP